MVAGANVRRLLAWAQLAWLFAAAGCLVGPDYRPPATDVPGGWVGPGAVPSTQPSVTTTGPADVARWWTTFEDPTLDALVHRAIASNLDLRQAEARVRQARAARRVTAAGLLPTVDVSGTYRRSGTGGGDDDDSDVTGGGSFGSGDDARSLFQAGLDAAWELDVFGGVRRSVEAAEADIQSAVEDRRNVLVTLSSEVALNYLELREFQRRLAIAVDNLELQRRSAALTRRRFAGGLISRLDVVNADAAVSTTESQIPALEVFARQAIYNLGVLLGREPGTLVEELSAPAPIPLVPPEVPIRLPSDLLRRRPDIRRAESDLHAATARIGVATADLFPRFTLTGSLGLQGEQFSDLGNWSNRSWSFGPGVSWPLFDAGRIRANIAVQTAAQEQALLAYRSTVLVALQDVEDAFVAYAKEQQRRKALAEAVAANRQAVELATRGYTEGLTDFLNVLSAQRELLGSEDALAQSDRAIAANLVALYKALGGGWEAVP